MTFSTMDRPASTTDSIVLSAIAPCFNESANVGSLIVRTLAVFDELGVSAELVCVDDGSDDGTRAAITARAGADERVRLVAHDRREGVRRAWRSGLAASKGTLVCLIDADLQCHPEDIRRLYQKYLREVPDVVQGVRRSARGIRRRRPPHPALNAVLNRVFGMRLRDAGSSFLLCRRDVLPNLLDLCAGRRRLRHLLAAAAHARGYTIAEVDTDYEARVAGRSVLRRVQRLTAIPAIQDCREAFELRAGLMRGTAPRRSHDDRTSREPSIVPSGIETNP